MPDVRADRGAYLDRVAARLRLPDERARDVLDELDGHLSESIAGFVDQGMTLEQAERQSIARLGDPDALADGLRRAQQSRRRLLVAAGWGVVAAVSNVIWGYLIALAVGVVAGVLSLAIISTIVSWLQLSVAGWGQWGDEVAIPFAAFVAGYAGRRFVLTVAWKSLRRVDAIQVPIALIGGGLLAILVVFGVRGEVHPASIVLLLSMPIGFAVGAMVARDGNAERTRSLPARWLGIAMVVATVIGTVMGLASLRINPPDPYTVANEYSTIGPPATDVLGAGWLDQQSSTGLGFLGGCHDLAATHGSPGRLARRAARGLALDQRPGRAAAPGRSSHCDRPDAPGRRWHLRRRARSRHVEGATLVRDRDHWRGAGWGALRVDRPGRPDGVAPLDRHDLGVRHDAVVQGRSVQADHRVR